MSTFLTSNSGRVDVWRPPGLPGLEFQRASEVRHFNPSEHIHAEYQIVLVQRGGRVFRHRGRTMEAGPGQIVVVGPGEVHAGRCADGTACCFRSLYLDQAHLREASSDPGIPRGPGSGFVSLIDDGGLADLLLRLDLALRGAVTRIEAQTLLALFCRRLALRGAAGGKAEEGPSARIPPHPPSLRRAREHLDAHYAEEVALDDLARVAGLSKYHFLRAFAAAFGLPPHAYQIQLRVMRAKALVAGGMPLKAVAAETGFADQSHLGRHFRRLTGLSPAAYGRGGTTASP